MSHSHLDPRDGLPRVGQILRDRDVEIGKISMTQPTHRSGHNNRASSSSSSGGHVALGTTPWGYYSRSIHCLFK